MNISGEQLLMGLSIAVMIVTLIILYHVLFIVVDVRKITSRISGITEQVEEIVMKPLSMADGILQWVTEQVEAQSKKVTGNKKK